VKRWTWRRRWRWSRSRRDTHKDPNLGSINLLSCDVGGRQEFFKSLKIPTRFLHGVGRTSEFGNGAHAFMDGPALPIPIFTGLHFLLAGVDADGLVHASVYSGLTRFAMVVSIEGCLALRPPQFGCNSPGVLTSFFRSGVINRQMQSERLDDASQVRPGRVASIGEHAIHAFSFDSSAFRYL